METGWDDMGNYYEGDLGTVPSMFAAPETEELQLFDNKPYEQRRLSYPTYYIIKPQVCPTPNQEVAGE